jgi:hypothetical protein
VLKVPHQFFKGNRPEVKPLAPRKDGRQDLLWISGRQNEDDMRGRFLKALEKRVEGFLGEHVNFVDDVDLVPTSQAVTAGTLKQSLPEHAGIVNSTVRRRVNFDQQVQLPTV